MPRTEEQIEELVREMYSAAESAEWNLDPEEIRTHRARRGIPLPDVKVLVLVAAAVILIVVGIVVANGSQSRRSVASPPTSSTTSSNPQTVAAPNLVGLTQVQAGTVLGRSGLNVGNITAAPSALYAAGLVVNQTPAAGSSVSPGGSVDMTVSTGPSGTATTTQPGAVIVPSLTGLPQAQAATALGQAGLNVGSVSSATSNNFAPGQVISESPSSGSSVVPGSSVDIVVSSGPPGTTGSGCTGTLPANELCASGTPSG